jgi:gas vesicle protein
MKFRDLTDLDKNDILGALGLQSKPSASTWMMGTFGLFGLGVLVGAGVALLLAPKPGDELRRDIGTRIKTVRDQMGAAVNNGRQSLEGDRSL